MAKVGFLELVQIQNGERLTELTKFGGQPNWIGRPEWPLSRKTGRPLTFLGQVELVDEVFGETTGRVAYLFLNTDEDAEDTWNPDGGEIGVVVQPGRQTLPTAAEPTGPTVEHAHYGVDPERPCEFRVNLEIREAPDPESDEWTLPRIGGEPDWIQAPEEPYGDAKLVVQMEDGALPFYANFGTGYAYAFVNGAGDEGKMLWQC